MLAPAQQGFDIWGPIQRRKYLITLFLLDRSRARVFVLLESRTAVLI